MNVSVTICVSYSFIELLQTNGNANQNKRIAFTRDNIIHNTRVPPILSKWYIPRLSSSAQVQYIIANLQQHIFLVSCCGKIILSTFRYSILYLQWKVLFTGLEPSCTCTPWCVCMRTPVILPYLSFCCTDATGDIHSGGMVERNTVLFLKYSFHYFYFDTLSSFS